MIDYSKISDSIFHYNKLGYQRIESPWTVTKAISDITAPPNTTYFTIEEKNKVLVASGEQSLLYLYNKGFLPKGKFQTITPCFRNDSFDEMHTKYFIKNELMITDDISYDSVTKIINDAYSFFKFFFKNDVGLTTIKTGENSWDICYRNNELGSYGIRSCSFLNWIYGTGVAEPRLSKILEKYGIS
jgi:hypothetical protein